VITANYISKEIMYQNISIKGGWGSNEASDKLWPCQYKYTGNVFIVCVWKDLTPVCITPYVIWTFSSFTHEM